MIRHILAFGFAALWLQGATVLAQTQVCVPQFLDGNSGPFQWRTTLVLQNQDQAQAQVQLNFYDNNGTPMRQFEMRRRGGPGSQAQVGPGGQFDPEPIRAGFAVGYQSGGQGALQAGYVSIQSQNRIQVQSRLQLFDSVGNLISEAIVVPGEQFSRSGFYADQAGGAGIGLALTNPSANQTAICTLEIIGADGIAVLGTTQIALGPHSQTARFLFELFPSILTDDVGFVRITCSEPVCALALQLRGLAMAQIPVVIED
jgi:hypothetical protein